MREMNAQSKFTVQTVYIYITEKCNLDCAYCYLRRKKDRSLDKEVMSAFLHSLHRGQWQPDRFEISGGEPLLCWDVVKRAVELIRQIFPGAGIGMQTNGTLLDRNKVAFLKRNGVAVEFGIDGKVDVSTRWRTGLEEAGFHRLVANIRMSIRAGLSVGCNVTVHPDSVRDLASNCAFLAKLGVRCLDVTPAAFTKWTQRANDEFKKQYGEIMAVPELKRRLYKAEDRHCLSQAFLDLSLHPSGSVMCGDAYLCLPDKCKRLHSVWNPVDCSFLPDRLAWFLRAYAVRRRNLKRHIYTHRDYVCASFQIVNELIGRKYINTDEIIPLMLYLTRTHVSFG